MRRAARGVGGKGRRWGTEVGRSVPTVIDVVRRASVALPETNIAELRAVGEQFLRASALIRERARLETELLHAQRVGTIGMLAGGIVHDLNNQLSALLSMLQVLQESGAESEDVQIALSAARTCAELTRGILAFSRGSAALKRVALDAGELVRNVVRLIGGTLRASSVDVVTDLSPFELEVLGERVLLEQVLMNLALNALDAMPDGGRLTFSTRRTADGYVAFRVADTGHGMTEAVRARVFEAFFTTKPPGKGTGLGLSMVRGIVTAHRGKLEVESAPGKGTTFTVLVPALETAAVVERSA